VSFLITGSNGYLGETLVSILKKHNQNILTTSRSGENNSYKCDLTVRNEVKKLISDLQPKTIIHCASFVPKNPKDYDNTINNLNLVMLENILKCSDAKIIFISSMTVYGNSENANKKSFEHIKPTSAYALNKTLCENLVTLSNNRSIILRIPGLYGGRRKDGLVYNVVSGLLKNQNLILPDKPLFWAAMDIYDLAKCIYKIIELDLDSTKTVFNISYKEPYSINHFIEICEDIFSIKIKYDVKHPIVSFYHPIIKAGDYLPESSFRDSIVRLKENYV